MTVAPLLNTKNSSFTDSSLGPLRCKTSYNLNLYNTDTSVMGILGSVFLNLDMAPRNSIPGGFAYIRQSKWVGIIAIKTERTQIHFLSDILVAFSSLRGSLSNKDGDGYENVTYKAKSRCFKLYRTYYSISFNSSNALNFFWSWILKECNEVQEKKNKVVLLCSRPPQYVKLGSFTS